jgi:hypothetical protein
MRLPHCLSCKHYVGSEEEGPETCLAFPAGIPWDIYEGPVMHYEPYPGQVGDYLYSPRGLDPRLLPPKTGSPQPIELGLARLVKAIRETPPLIGEYEK